jgi:hypothetical protein
MHEALHLISSTTRKKLLIILNTGKNVDKLDLSYIVDRAAKWHNSAGKQFGRFL